jgi:hypothetical protein
LVEDLPIDKGFDDDDSDKIHVQTWWLIFTLVQLNIFALTSPGSSLSRAWPSFDNGPKLGFIYDKAFAYKSQAQARAFRPSRAITSLSLDSI